MSPSALSFAHATILAVKTPEPAFSSDKRARIVEAMRRSVSRRGVQGSTFGHVASDADVSRGLLHHYFGTKERLLAEVVRRDCDVREKLIEERVANAQTATDLVSLLVSSQREWFVEEQEFITFLFEMFVISRRNDDIAVAFAEVLRRTRALVEQILARKQAEGVLRLADEPAVIADLLCSLADGIAFRMLGDPDADVSGLLEAATRITRELILDA